MNWQELRTRDEAAEKARETIDQTATAQEWWQQGRDYAERAVSFAYDAATDETAGTFWLYLEASWAGAGDAFPDGVKPKNWDKLEGVWSSARATYGSALATEDAQSLKTIVLEGLKGTVEDATGTGTEEPKSFPGKVVKFAGEHPVVTVLGVFGLIIIYQAAPAIVARLVVR